MLFHLNTLRAVVIDIPMDAKYADEVSGLEVSKIIGEFLFKHIRNFSKRIFYNYYLRDFIIGVARTSPRSPVARFWRRFWRVSLVFRSKDGYSDIVWDCHDIRSTYPDGTTICVGFFRL